MSDTILILEDTGDAVYKKKLKRKKLPVPDSLQADISGQTVFEKGEIHNVDMEISECQSEINFIDHLPTCEENCMVYLHLNVTRYLPRAQWWLQDDEEYKENGGVCNIDGSLIDIEDMPKIREYQISSYWYFTKETDADTDRFIHDRCKWAKNYFENRIAELKLRNECIEEIGMRW